MLRWLLWRFGLFVYLTSFLPIPPRRRASKASPEDRANKDQQRRFRRHLAEELSEGAQDPSIVAELFCSGALILGRW